VTHETIRQWGLKFGQEFANRIRRRAPRRGDGTVNLASAD
jgi:putative transposase